MLQLAVEHAAPVAVVPCCHKRDKAGAQVVIEGLGSRALDFEFMV